MDELRAPKSVCVRSSSAAISIWIVPGALLLVVCATVVPVDFRAPAIEFISWSVYPVSALWIVALPVAGGLVAALSLVMEGDAGRDRNTPRSDLC